MSARRHLPDGTLVVLARRSERPVPAAAERHLSRCARCRALLADFRLLREHLVQAPPSPGPALLARVFALVGSRPPRARESARFALASLRSDSGPALLSAGWRSGVHTRQQSWSISGADVDLRLQPAGLGSPGSLLGQIFPHARAGSSTHEGGVWLTQRGRASSWAALGEAGEFELPAPAEGRWVLWVEWNGVRARLESR